MTGVFLALISATGIALQVQQLLEKDSGPADTARHVVAEPRAEDSDDRHGVVVAGVLQQHRLEAGRQRADGRDLHETLMHIHSGEFVGKGGTVAGLLSGCAPFFFSLSGIWMYWRMFKARAKVGRREIFWS